MKWVRKISATPEANQKFYLTFDDGPVRDGTDGVLKILEQFGMKATFFVVAKQARFYPTLLKKIVSEGHTIGNHSSDHGYKNFFKGKNALKKWILDSEAVITDVIGSPTVGFRPPAGVVTPELISACNEIHTPLILWNVRYFDKIIPWTERRALSSLKRTKPGSIILLHDHQKASKLSPFLQTFHAYCKHAQTLNYSFAPLTKELCLSENQR